MRVTRKVDTEEFRRDVVNLLKTTDRPFKKVAEHLGATELSLRRGYNLSVPKKSRKQRKAEAAKRAGAVAHQISRASALDHPRL